MKAAIDGEKAAAAESRPTATDGGHVDSSGSLFGQVFSDPVCGSIYQRSLLTSAGSPPSSPLSPPVPCPCVDVKTLRSPADGPQDEEPPAVCGALRRRLSLRLRRYRPPSSHLALYLCLTCNIIYH